MALLQNTLYFIKVKINFGRVQYENIKQLILISACAIGTFFSSSSIYAIPPKFTPETDEALVQAVAQVAAQGPLSWTSVAKLVPNQTPRSCRTRWINYLCPIQIASWSRQDDELLLKKYKELGPKWNIISKFFKNKSEISVKNRYYLIRKNFNYFNLLDCSYRVKVSENGIKKLFCELKETSDNSNSRVQGVAIVPNSIK